MSGRSGSSVVVVALAASVLLAGCAPPVQAPAGAPADRAFPVTIEHVHGATTIPARPERIVALGSTDVEILYALDVDPVGTVTFPGFGSADADGVQPWVRPHVDPQATTFLPNGAEGVEQVAALRPDLILLTYGAVDDSVYRRLSQIAPTVASPAGDWTLDWRLQLDTVARAVGLTEEADALEAGLDDGIERLRTAHPELAGVSYSFVEVHSEGIWAYLSADPRNRLFQELGLVPSPGVAELDRAGDGAFFGDVSFELASTVDADVIVATTSTDTADSLYATPVLGGLDTVRSGAVAFYGQEDIVFLSALVPSPLTIPLSLERFAADVSAAVARTP